MRVALWQTDHHLDLIRFMRKLHGDLEETCVESKKILVRQPKKARATRKEGDIPPFWSSSCPSSGFVPFVTCSAGWFWGDSGRSDVSPTGDIFFVCVRGTSLLYVVRWEGSQLDKIPFECSMSPLGCAIRASEQELEQVA